MLSGCWDRTEVNDLAYVISTGFDKVEDNEFRISVQVPLPGSMGGQGSSGGGGGTGGSGPYYVDSGVGRNVRESNDDLQKRMSRQLYFSHRRIIIFGEELARGGFKKSLDVVLEQTESRLSTYVLLTDGEAIEILNATPHLEQLPSEAAREIAKSSVGITVKDVLEDIAKPGKDPVIPKIEKTLTQNGDSEDKKEELKINGFGVLKGEKLAFFTTKQEAIGVMWLLEEFKGANYTFSVGEKNELNVKIHKNKVNPTFKVKNGQPSFTLNISIASTMMQNEPNLKLSEKKNYQQVKKQFENQVKDEVMAILQHSMKEGIDLYGLGFELYLKENKQWEEKWAQNWEEILPELTVDVKVDAEITRTINSGINVKE